MIEKEAEQADRIAAFVALQQRLGTALDLLRRARVQLTESVYYDERIQRYVDLVRDIEQELLRE